MAPITEGMTEAPLSELVTLLAEVCVARGEAPINQLDGCWHLSLAGPPTVEAWMNGHREARKTEQGVTVQPYHAYVELNGWPWCIANPYGGDFLGGSDTEDAVIALLKAELVRASRQPDPALGDVK